MMMLLADNAQLSECSENPRHSAARVASCGRSTWLAWSWPPYHDDPGQEIVPEPPIAAGQAQEEIEQPQDQGPGRDIEEKRVHRRSQHADGTARRSVNHAKPH